jgi:hypothetical protein
VANRFVCLAETASPSTDKGCTDTSGVASAAKTGKGEMGQAGSTQEGDDSTREGKAELRAFYCCD